MQNPVDLIRRRLSLNTDADVAAFVGVIPQAVSAWRKRAKVPSDRHWQIVDKAVAQDLLPVEQAADFAREIWQASQPVNDPMKNEAA